MNSIFLVAGALFVWAAIALDKGEISFATVAAVLSLFLLLWMVLAAICRDRLF